MSDRIETHDDAAKAEVLRADIATITDDEIKRLIVESVAGIHTEAFLGGLVNVWLKRNFARLQDADTATLDRDRAEALACLIDLLTPSLAQATGRPLQEAEDQLRRAIAAVDSVG